MQVSTQTKMTIHSLIIGKSAGMFEAMPYISNSRAD